MANVRQLPMIHLRGSLANITMPRLTIEQRQHVAVLTDQIVNNPDMNKHKNKIMRKLRTTIGGDYASDQEAAQQEFEIAVWRGVVDLFYHRKYSFKCRACGTNSHFTKRGRLKLIDRIGTHCQGCNKVEIKDPGDVPELRERFNHGDLFLTVEDFQASYRDLPDGFAAPKSCSPIEAIPGPLKYDNPQAIIDDPQQARKFFGEFTWNYFRQTINENKRESKSNLIPMVGQTDWLITREIIALCDRMEVAYNFCDKLGPKEGKYVISLCGHTTPPEFTIEYALLVDKASKHGVRVVATTYSIEVEVNPNATPLPLHWDKKKRSGEPDRPWQIKVVKSAHVNVVDNHTTTGNDDQDSDFTISQIDYKTVEGNRMDPDDHVGTVDNKEAMVAVREALPDGDARAVFDILSQQGEAYDDFTKTYNYESMPKVNHIARFLGTTTRQINSYKKTIGLHMLNCRMVPR